MWPLLVPDEEKHVCYDEKEEIVLHLYCFWTCFTYFIVSIDVYETHRLVFIKLILTVIYSMLFIMIILIIPNFLYEYCGLDNAWSVPTMLHECQSCLCLVCQLTINRRWIGDRPTQSWFQHYFWRHLAIYSLLHKHPCQWSHMDLFSTDSTCVRATLEKNFFSPEYIYVTLSTHEYDIVN